MDFNFLGHIEGIRYTDTSVIVTASERRKGYKRKDGTSFDDEILSYRFIFKPYFKKYIASHFSKSMLVKIKGFMLPYAKDHNGDTIDGYSLIGQTIDIATYQANSTRLERKMIKESQSSTFVMPDLEDYNKDDF